MCEWSGPLKRILLLSTLIISSMVFFPSVIAEPIDLEDDLSLEVHPFSLTLKPLEQGSFELRFENTGNKTYFISPLDGDPNYTWTSNVEISPDWFQLEAGETRTVTVLIESRSHIFSVGDPGCKVTITWGSSLTVSVGRIDPSTVEGSTWIYLQVDDDYYLSHPICVGSLILVNVIIIVVLMIGALKLRGRQRPTARNGP